ncbi:MAG TPA: hypothetical protein VHM90_19235 [Phycisphaerae bacterium]|nr:hypothetical protein [Phycisphaerae bacterium]
MTLLNLEMNLRVVGALLFVLAALNLVLPRKFSWHTELQRLTLLTRQIFIVHCCFIVLVLILMGALALFFAPLLLDHSPLARLVLSGLALFWGVRLFFQWFVYSPKLWRGNRLNTTMHIVFSAVWLYFSATFATAWVRSFH